MHFGIKTDTDEGKEQLVVGHVVAIGVVVEHSKKQRWAC